MADNSNYFYEFESYCPKCHTAHDISLAIRRGQFVGIYFKEEANNINILDLENIEDGYQRRIDYENMCATKLGNECLKTKIKRKHVGESINALKTDWLIEEVYAEERIPQLTILFDRTYLYRVTDGTSRRLIYARTGIAGTYLTLEEDDLDKTGEIHEDEKGNKYIMKYSKKYIKLIRP